MPRIDVEAEVAKVRDPFSRRQSRIVWEFHNKLWYGR